MSVSVDADKAGGLMNLFSYSNLVHAVSGASVSISFCGGLKLTQKLSDTMLVCVYKLIMYATCFSYL